MKNKEIVLRDYEWVLRVISSCNTINHWDGAMNCYDLWLKKHSSNDSIHILSLSQDIYSKLSNKLTNLYHEKVYRENSGLFR